MVDEIVRHGRKRGKPRPSTWEDWSAEALGCIRAHVNGLKHSADPWVRKAHSLTVAARLSAKFVRTHPTTRTKCRSGWTWSKWAEDEQKELKAEVKRAHMSPWERWAMAKYVTLRIRSRCRKSENA